MKRVLRAAALLSVLTFGASTVRGGEQDDIENQVISERAVAVDLEHLDELHVAGPDIKLLKAWIDEAWSFRMQHDYDRTRAVFDRTLSQEELIRQEIATSKLAAEAKKREAALKDRRLMIARARSALAKVEKDEKVSEKTTK